MRTTKFNVLAAGVLGSTTVALAVPVGTGFEQSEGFYPGQPFPAGWTGYNPAIGTAHFTGGTQALELANGAYAGFWPNFAIEPGRVTRVSVCVRTADYAPGPYDNFMGYGGLYVYDQSFYYAGGVLFDLRDYSGSGWPSDLPDPEEYGIYFPTADGQNWQYVSAFAIGTWYRFTMTIDATAGTVSNDLTLLDGTPVASNTVSLLVTSVPLVTFGGANTSINGPAYHDDFYIGSATISPCGPADLTTTGTTNGIPDGVINGSDFTYYLSLFAVSSPTADLTTTGTINGIADGIVNGSDFTYFLALFATGCP